MSAFFFFFQSYTAMSIFFFFVHLMILSISIFKKIEKQDCF